MRLGRLLRRGPPAGAIRHPFEARLIEVRKRVKPEPFDWYTWDSLGNVTNFEAFLPGGIARVAEMAGDEGVADIGAGDGDIAFLLESLGCRVVVMDWPGTNANQMRGLETMKRELGSSVEIREVDLDDRFRLDGERFGVAVALGLLYHLKNPFYFLERLAMHARYAMLSTQILPRGRRPIAYLSADREYNDDPTNYWFFSKPGVLRLLDRCGWDVTHSHVTGDRFHCVAESRIAKTRQTIRLLEGWNGIENDAWRWSRREFGFVVDNTGGARRFELRFFTNRPGSVTIQAEVNGVLTERQSFDGAGDHVYSVTVADAARQRVVVRLSDAAVVDGRELGVVVRLPLNTVLDDESGIRFV